MSNLFLKPEDFERIFTSHLKIETYAKSIETLFSLRLLNRINYKPYYQRNYVWDNHKASYFIESILLGTEIPPLIFFNNGKDTEVIDGRQRFETIKRFKDNDFALTKKGLSTLKQISKSTYDSLINNPETANIIDIFLDAKIRIIEFEIVNEPRLDSGLEDKIKKEIFGRYNSGITPLKKPEIDNAVYDKDSISQYFKDILKNDKDFVQLIYSLFFKKKDNKQIEPDTGKILQFIRRYLVLNKFPIKYYAGGHSRIETLEKLYDYLSDSTEEIKSLCSSFIDKVRMIHSIKEVFLTMDFQDNHLVFECLLWGLLILENENFDLSRVTELSFVKRMSKIISNNIEKYTEIESHFYSQIVDRYSFTAKIFEEEFNLSLQVYLEGSSQKRNELKKLRQTEDEDTVTKLGELESLRITKPDPSRNSIDDIVRVMDRKRFLVRPSYQRSEVINLSKASAIIESILLGINLPPIFIFKRSDGISEVIDGQQRLLTILGFINKEYVDEDNNRCTTKNSNFTLRGLRILTNLDKKRFTDLEQTLQDKILDFELLVVEIEERLNPEFNPVDLFVRLNDKPYPIRENSFEMWNSWVDRDVITKIKENVNKHREWFHLKLARNPNDRDRMENEELYASLVYLQYQSLKDHNIFSYLYIYKQNDRINSRIGSAKDITSVLTTVSDSETQDAKNLFLDSIKNFERFISKVKLVLLDKDIEKNELNSYFKTELDSLYKARKESRSFRRTKQDFYILWYALNTINYQMVKYYRLQIKTDLQEIFVNFNMKKMSDNHSDTISSEKFIALINEFHQKYKKQERSLKLTESEKEELIKQQGNQCAISGAPMFIGDEIEIDHDKPLAIGGSDSKDNLQITHKDSNRSKGVNYLDK